MGIRERSVSSDITVASLRASRTKTLRRITAVVGTPNVDAVINHPNGNSGEKHTYGVREEAEAMVASIIGEERYRPELLDQAEKFVGGNPTNVSEALHKLQPWTRRARDRITKRFSVVPYITAGNDGYANLIVNHVAFRGKAVVTRYEDASVVNTVINGLNRTTVSLAPESIPGGFNPRMRKGTIVDVYLTSVKGQDWQRTYIDAAVHKARHPESILAVSPGSKQIQEKGNPRDVRNPLYRAIRSADILFVNKEEGLALIGEPEKSRMPIAQIILKLHALGPKVISLTDGPNGSHAFADGLSFYLTPLESPNRLGKKKFVNSLGAGDAYAAAFLQSYIDNLALEIPARIAEAMRRGAINAHHVIRTKDAHSGQLRRRSMDRIARRTRDSFQPVVGEIIPGLGEARADGRTLLDKLMEK